MPAGFVRRFGGRGVQAIGYAASLPLASGRAANTGAWGFRLVACRKGVDSVSAHQRVALAASPTASGQGCKRICEPAIVFHLLVVGAVWRPGVRSKA